MTNRVAVDVHDEARKFAVELQEVLDAVLPVPTGADPEQRRVNVIVQGTRYAVHPGCGTQPALITLTSKDVPVATLKVSYFCVADRRGHFLAVLKSTFELRELDDRTPLLRADYVRRGGRVPASHWNVHAERGALSRLLACTNPTHTAQLSKIHLPVGGARHRVCLEDFLQLLLIEFNVDREPRAMQAINAGRERWRRLQIATLTRDAPEVAAGVLESLGYTVTPPDGGHPSADSEALQRW